jgi:hypothetical protein
MSTEIAECMGLARTELQIARQKIAEEIASYPSPIAGCDSQFNHLLAQRKKVNAALAALTHDVHIPTPRQP